MGPLADTPWADQADGAPHIDEVAPWPSLVFPPGVDYRQALTELFVALREGRGLPDGVSVAAPLPPEVVVVNDDGRVRLSLTAPWGWTPDTRLVRAPSFHLPGNLPADEVQRRFVKMERAKAALPEGAVVDAPVLEDCQVAVGVATRRPSC